MKKNSLKLAVLSMVIASSFYLVGCSSTDDKVATNDFPEKNITMIVPFGAGGGTDTVGRALAKSMEKSLGNTVVVTNRTGGAGAVGMTTGANAKADGYTLTVVTREIVSLPLLNLAQITSEDFDLLGLVNLEPAIILVEKDSPYQNVKDLIEDARENEGKVKMASTAQPNFYALGIEVDQNIKFNQIPFNGAAEAIPAVLGGHVDFTIVTPGEASAQIESGQLRAIGLMDSDRVDTLPEVETLKEQGYDITSGTWRGIAVPKDTPEDVRIVLEKAVAEAVQDEDFIRIMENANTAIKFLTGEEFTEFVNNDVSTIEKIVNAME